MTHKYKYAVAIIVTTSTLYGCSTAMHERIPPMSDQTSWHHAVHHKLIATQPSLTHFAIGSTQWLEQVSTAAGIYDAEGHGPDLDSEEWRAAVNWKLFKNRTPE